MKGVILVLILVVFVLIIGCISESQKTDVTNHLATSSYNIPGSSSENQISSDMVCIIDQKEQVFTTASKKALAFNLVNPPMYINYTIPETKKGSDGIDNSYYIITVREKNSANILLQAEFGKMPQGGFFGYPFSGSDVIRIMRSNDLIIEMEGKDVTINYQILVNPSHNVDSSFDVNTANCIKWPQEYREGVMHSSGMNIAIDRLP